MTNTAIATPPIAMDDVLSSPADIFFILWDVKVLESTNSACWILAIDSWISSVVLLEVWLLQLHIEQGFPNVVDCDVDSTVVSSVVGICEHGYSRSVDIVFLFSAKDTEMILKSSYIDSNFCIIIQQDTR